MNDKPGDLKLRTKDFALRIIRMYCALPKSTEAQVLGKQILRSGTSVGAHYREATRARSDAEFISKLESGVINPEKLSGLMNEARELNAMLTASVKTVKTQK